MTDSLTTPVASTTADTKDNNEKSGYLVIYGETTSGSKFRPSDWCDRLHGTLRALGDEQREYFSDFVHIVNYEGKRCILLNQSLEAIDARLYGFFIRFAKDNLLNTHTITREHWHANHDAR